MREATPPPRKKSRPSNGVSRRKEKQVEVDGRKEVRVTLSPQTTPMGDPPEPEELIKALQVCKSLKLHHYIVFGNVSLEM